MKKILIFALFLLSTMLLLAGSISATDTIIAEGNCGDDITWKIYDRNAGKSDEPHYQLVFSGTGELKGYTSDGFIITYSNQNDSQFSPYEEYIYEAVVEDGITSIGQSGIAFFINLHTIEIPADLTTIGYMAFAGNGALERVSVRGNNTFLGADLSNITSFGTHVFDGCEILRYVLMNPNYEGELKNEVFKNCDRLTTITIPAGVTKLGPDTFEGCDGLESVVFLGDPTLGDQVFLNLTASKITLYSPVSGGNVETFATAKGFGFSNTTPTIESEFYSSDPNVIDIGKCAADVFYKLVKGEDGNCTMYTFGTGSTMSAIACSGDTVGYYTVSTAYWYPHRSLITKIILSENVKTMSGLACGFMPNLTHVEITEKLTGITGACFESSTNFGTLYMKGNEPKEGHIDYTNIMRLGSYTFDGCEGVKSIEFAEYPTSTFLGYELFKGCINLHSVKLPFNLTEVRKYAFRNCDSLKDVVFFSDTTIDENAFYECDDLTAITITGLRDSHAKAFAEANGMKFIPPNILSIYMDGELQTEIDVVDSSYLVPRLINDTICLLYTDEGCTVPYDYAEPVYDNMTLYALPLVSHEGFMVRTVDYNGLRSIYKFNINASKGDSLYNIKELGSIASAERDIRGTTSMTADDNYIYLNTVIKNNVLVGKLSAYPSGNSAQFAHTSAGGYETDGVLNAKNATEQLYFRCYVIIENKETGETYELYSDVVSATLQDKAAKTIEAGEGILDTDEIEFLTAPAQATYDREKVYTEDELKAYISEIYADKEHVLYGQQISTNTVDAFANYLAMFRDETGDYPAVVGIDQSSINQGEFTDEEKTIFFDDLLEYARRGGIITLSIHLTNPADATQGYRGELGFEDAWEEILTEDSELNLSLHTYLAQAAETLQYLEDRGIPVLFRPLHEMNISSFWWCVNQTVDGETKVLPSQYIVRLWKYYYKYFEETCELDNLVWVYGPNYTNNTSKTSGTQHVMYAYPGDEYVEMVGCDWYTSTGDYTEIDGDGKSLSSLIATGYPVAITEFGPSGTLLPVDDGEHPYKAMKQLQIIKDITYELGYSIVYMLNWTGKWSIYNMGDSNEFMADEMIYGTNETYYGLIGNNLK
ncbi:MAG: leucine-rich repeat protein [Clostridia bacterium]|nr:leucine-rich repeat protein [Clostridia bacterium]